MFLVFEEGMDGENGTFFFFFFFFNPKRRQDILFLVGRGLSSPLMINGQQEERRHSQACHAA